MNTIDLKDALSQLKRDDSVDSILGNSKYEDIDRQIKKEELRKLQLRNDALEGTNAGDRQDASQRKDFAERIFSFVSVYMVFVFLIVFLCASEYACFSLSDNVLMTLLGTTTANVVGILIIVVAYLFSRKKG